MKTTITQNGSLLIEPESNLEVFFINQMNIKNIEIRKTITWFDSSTTPCIKIIQNKDNKKGE